MLGKLHFNVWHVCPGTMCWIRQRSVFIGMTFYHWWQRGLGIIQSNQDFVCGKKLCSWSFYHLMGKPQFFYLSFIHLITSHQFNTKWYHPCLSSDIIPALTTENDRPFMSFTSKHAHAQISYFIHVTQGFVGGSVATITAFLASEVMWQRR